MATQSLTATPKLFFTLAEFHAAGGPCHTNAYKLDAQRLLTLTHPPGCKVGVTAAEAARFFASAPTAKRDLSKATNASLKARGKR
jgi:hypothetical protein